MPRKPENIIAALVADRGEGKTTYITGDESIPLPGIIDKYLKKGMKVLIIDTYDHPSYRHIPRIRTNQIAFWKKGVYRFYGNKTEIKELFDVISKKLFNCAVVCEDAVKYIDADVPDALVDFMIDTKQKNIDLYFLYHAWGWIPKALFRLIDAFEVFRSGEHPKVRKDQLGGCYDRVLEIWERISKSGKQYEHETVFK